MGADQVFAELKQAVDRACAAKDYGIAVEAAKALGFQKIDESKSFSLRLKFIGQFGDGTVILEFRSWDQSQAFSVRPDMNRFTLTLKTGEQVVREHRSEFED